MARKIYFFAVIIILKSFYLTSESIIGWGSIYYAALCIGKDVSYEVPVKVLNMSNAVEISAGGSHSISVKNNGTVWAWGLNKYGQLGDGKFDDKNLPTKTISLENVKKVSGGSGHTLALKEDGTVWGWGSDFNCELGQGESIVYSSEPLKVLNIDGIVDIAAGGAISFALKEDGTIWGWGANYFGQLGTGTITDYSCVPVKVKDLEDIKEVDVSGVFKPFSLALKNDGTVWAWGFNTYGQLGTGTNMNSIYPVKVLIENVKQISAGGYHALALKEDGTVWGWGYNEYGQLGNGTNIDSNIPVRIPNLTDITAVEAGVAHSLFLRKDGTVLACGYNEWGQLGDGTNIDKNIPVPVLNLKDIMKISSFYHHNLALDKNGFVWAWGDNYYGQIGNGYDNYIKSPKRIETLVDMDILSLSSGSHTLILNSNYDLYVCGNAEYGQLGIGAFPKELEKKNINFPTKVIFENKVRKIAAGSYHSLILDENKNIWGAGDNFFGQVGIGTKDRFISYFQKNNYLSNIIEISAGDKHSLALKSDGTVWAWGWNVFGQLGDGTNINSNYPVKVLIENVKIISAGFYHNLAIKEDGTVWAWGWNRYGQLGIGNNIDQNIPVQVLNLKHIVKISAGSTHSLALDKYGKLWGWGNNEKGQLGIEGNLYFEVPIQIEWDEDIKDIIARPYESILLTKSGSVYNLSNRSKIIENKKVLEIFNTKGPIFAIYNSDHDVPF